MSKALRARRKGGKSKELSAEGTGLGAESKAYGAENREQNASGQRALRRRYGQRAERM
jgi:hypothetical protein